jgi:hypothetical protein
MEAMEAEADMFADISGRVVASEFSTRAEGSGVGEWSLVVDNLVDFRKSD